MAVVTWVFIGILALTFIILAILLGMTLTKNQKLSAQSLYIPFTAKINPKTGQSTPFDNSLGKPQLSCPVGKKINIIGAFFDVFDPYTECSTDITDVDPHFAYLCDPSMHSPKSCSSDKDCPGWTLGAGNNPFMCDIPKGEGSGFCKLRNIGSGKPCPKGTGFNFTNVGGFCIDTNTCGTNIYNEQGQNVKMGVPNPYCSPNNSIAQCAVRDASATVAAKCDGQQECTDLSMKDFGDLPCLGAHMEPDSCLVSSSTGVSFKDPNRKGYCGLPFIPGYPGGVPASAAGSGTSDPANGNIGYTMHGIYTCV